MALNSIIQRFRSHYNQKSNCKKSKTSRSNSIKRNPSTSKNKSISTKSSKKHTNTPQPSSNPVVSNQPILSSHFVEDNSNLSVDPILQLSSLQNHSSLSLNTNPSKCKVVHSTTNISRTVPSTPVTAKFSPISLDTDHIETHNSPSTSHFSSLSIPNHSHHYSSSSELSSPTSPAATSVPSHDSTHSFKDPKNGKRQSSFKEDQLGKDGNEFNPKSRPQASKSNSFWKRMSRNSTLMQQIKKESSDKSNNKLDSISSQEVNKLEPRATKQLDQEAMNPEHKDHQVKSTSNFNEIDLNSQPETPTPTQSNLTGVGTKNRNSFQKLPSNTSFSEIPTNKRSSRPLSNYSPINSSPLSTQSNLNQFQRPTLQNTEKRSSYVSSNRLSIIPDGSLTSSDDLMKLLRGPSPYPMEAQPQYFSNSAPNSRPVSRQSRLINEI